MTRSSDRNSKLTSIQFWHSGRSPRRPGLNAISGQHPFQHGSYFPNQPIHQFLPFGSSGLAHFRWDPVDP